MPLRNVSKWIIYGYDVHVQLFCLIEAEGFEDRFRIGLFSSIFIGTGEKNACGVGYGEMDIRKFGDVDKGAPASVRCHPPATKAASSGVCSPKMPIVRSGVGGKERDGPEEMLAMPLVGVN